MVDFDKAYSTISYGIQRAGSDKNVKMTPVDCSSELQIEKDSGWLYDLSRDEGEETKVFQDTKKGKYREISSRRKDLSRKVVPKRVGRRTYSRGSGSRLRDLEKGIFRENIDQGTKVYKDAFDLSWDNQIEENTMVLRNMHNMEVNIAEYATWSLPDFLWTHLV